jgi:NAD(P)-dependent dehydrogenase (short-subunit alcohol dehydrogenase family)
MKTVVITGVSRGLGLALLKKLHSMGHRVSGCCRQSQRAEDLESELGDRCLVRCVDVLDEHAVAQWAQETRKKLGEVDLVVNNAALFNARANLWETPVADFQQVMRVNVEGPYQVARAFLPAMISRGHGVLVNYTSSRARNPRAEVGPYCTSKAAVEMMTRSLALELPEGLAAVAVNPGVVNTEMLGVSIGDRKNEFWTPEQWAESAAPFLLELAPSDNGKCVHVPENSSPQPHSS